MEPEKKSNGALIGLVVIIIVLVIGGIYIWISNQKTLEEKKIQSNNITAQDSADLNTLEADVNATDTSTGVNVNAVN